MKNADIIRIENVKSGGSTFIIRWDMTRLCNYNCDFCIQGDKATHISEGKGESPKIRKEICNKLVKFIEQKLNSKYKHLQIYLIGGEVTILNDFVPILTNLVNCKFNGDIKFYLLTNLSVDKHVLKQIKKLFMHRNNIKLCLSASFYKEFTTEKEFMNKIKCLYNGNRVTNYLYNKKENTKKVRKKIYTGLFRCANKIFKENICMQMSIKYPLINDNDYKEFQKFKKKYAKYINPSTVINYIVIRDYKQTISDELKNSLPPKKDNKIKVTLKDGKVLYFNNTSSMVLAMKERTFNPKGFLCDSGISNLSISNVGDIYRCPCCPKQTTIGNVLTNDIELIHEKLICQSKRCYCDYYHMIENKKSNIKSRI